MDDRRLFLKSEDGLFLFWCPACQCAHYINRQWTISGSEETPTVSPSVRVKSVKMPPVDPATDDFKKDEKGNYLLGPDGRILGTKNVTCHLFIRNGQIEYLSDSTHEYAGKTIPMEKF